MNKTQFKASLLTLSLFLACSNINAAEVKTSTIESSTSYSSVLKTNVEEQRVIKGKVIGKNGEPIIGAGIVQYGTTNGAVTDVNGNFSITLVGEAPQLENLKKGNYLLKVSCLGYETQDVQVGKSSNIEIKLNEDLKMLSEAIVVVGFGEQKKENLTGAVAQVKMEDVLGDRPVINAMNSLQGAVPGLHISGGSTPGQSKNFNIRGMTSINGGGPLVLIDNVAGDINMLNPEDIESISVLKDASSAAIYGARAAFGVILVTTKKGQKDRQPRINYNNNIGFQNAINRPKQVSALEFLNAYKDADFLSGKYFAGQDIDQWINYLTEYKQDPSKFDIVGDGIYIPTENNPEQVRYYLNEKDLYDNMLEDYGTLQTHNLSVAGGSKLTSYRMSLGYNKENGILLTDMDNFRRVSSGAFVSTDVTKWLTQAIDIKYSRSRKEMPTTASGLYGLRICSLTPEGEMTASDGTMLPTNTPKNMLLNATPNVHKVENPRILSITKLKPVKGLEMVFEYTYDKKVTDYKRYNGPYNYTSIQLGNSRTADASKYENTKTSKNYNAINAYATYKFDLDTDHKFKLMCGFNQESSKFEKLYAYRLDMINEKYPSFSSSTGDKYIEDTYSEYAVRGAFFRVNYNYKGKYLFEANGRYDGSSKFPSHNRFGFFPSVSLGWNVAKEDFFKNLNSGISELKLRGSWGQIGNQAIAPYAFSPVMGAGKAPWIVDGDTPTTLYPPKLVSDSFTWETVQTFDIGFDLAAFDNKLNLTYDWYQRDTKDMLSAGIELPAVVGASAPLQNIADLTTKGWELSVNWRDYIGEFSYRVGFNLYDSKSEITKFLNESKLLNRYYEGRKIGEIWGYETDGFYTIDDFEDTNTWKLKEGITSIKGVNVRPGDHKFVNLMDDDTSVNQIDGGDNTVDNPGDRKVIGNTTPRYQFGINLGGSWRGLSLDIFLQGVGKRDYWDGGALRFPFRSGCFGSIFKGQLNYWKPTDIANGDYTPVDPNPDFYRIYGEQQNAGSNTRVQTKYLLDASYLRIKNITLGYILPTRLSTKIGLTKVKFFTSIENLHTFTSLPDGFDPERVNWGYPFYRTVSFGLNVTL